MYGPSQGIQLQHGDHAGRLMIAGNHRYTNDSTGTSWSHVMYSDDHGVTWKLGGGLSYQLNGVSGPNDRSSESTLVELTNGDLLMSIRVNGLTSNARRMSRSTDGGITWTDMESVPSLTIPAVQGDLLRLNDHVILLSAPSNEFSQTRREMTIWLSYDDGATWSRKKTVYFGFSGYSGMTVVGPDTILLAYNRGRTGGSFVEGDPGIPPFWFAETALARINLPLAGKRRPLPVHLLLQRRTTRPGRHDHRRPRFRTMAPGINAPARTPRPRPKRRDTRPAWPPIRPCN